MSTNRASPASITTPGTVQTGAREEQGVAFSGDGVSGARQLYVDVRMGSLLMREARSARVEQATGASLSHVTKHLEGSDFDEAESEAMASLEAQEVPSA